MKRTSAIMALGLLMLLLTGCFGTAGMDPYHFSDFETYLRPGTHGTSYKRIAVLYVGYTSASGSVQSDMGAYQGQPGNTSAQSEGYADDYMLYSNALLSSLAKRNVTLVERAQINDLVREQGLAQNEMLDLSDIEKVKRLGKLLKADLLVKGSLFVNTGAFRSFWYNGAYNFYYAGATGLTVSAIDTATGQVVWVDSALIDRRIPPDEMDKDKTISKATIVGEMVDQMVDRFFQTQG